MTVVVTARLVRLADAFGAETPVSTVRMATPNVAAPGPITVARIGWCLAPPVVGGRFIHPYRSSNTAKVTKCPGKPTSFAPTWNVEVINAILA